MIDPLAEKALEAIATLRTDSIERQKIREAQKEDGQRWAFLWRNFAKATHDWLDDPSDEHASSVLGTANKYGEYLREKCVDFWIFDRRVTYGARGDTEVYYMLSIILLSEISQQGRHDELMTLLERCRIDQDARWSLLGKTSIPSQLGFRVEGDS